MLTVTGLVAAATSVAYAIYVVAAGGQEVNAVLLGRPLPWLIARIATIAALICTVGVALAWRSASGRAERVRLGVAGAAGLMLIP